MATDVTQDRLAGTWNFNRVHSSAAFSINYLVAAFRGEFDQFEAQLADGQLSGSVEVASIDVKDENLAAHLQGPDFFDAENHPKITFRSSRITLDGDRAEIEGELTMRGVTKPIRATGTVSGPTEDFMGNTRLGFTFETTVNRHDFGVSWNADLPKGGKALADDVTLHVELEFVKAA